MSKTIVHVGNDDSSNTSPPASTTPTTESIRHAELMCELKELNRSMVVLLTYFALITNTKLHDKDIDL